MLAPVGELADGTYVVVWRTLSVVDGHVIRGSFAFGVGEPVAPDVAVAVASIESSPAAAVSRWLLFVGVAVLIGGPLQALVQQCGARPERHRASWSGGRRCCCWAVGCWRWRVRLGCWGRRS